MQVCEWTVFPALDLWDLVIDVLHSKSSQTHRNQLARGNPLHNKTSEMRKSSSKQDIPVSQGHLELSNVDFVSSNANSSHKGAMLYIFEDNEAVIKMIVKSRSPTMRLVSRTHRVLTGYWTELTWTARSKPNMSTKYVDQRKLHT